MTDSRSIGPSGSKSSVENTAVDRGQTSLMRGAACPRLGFRWDPANKGTADQTVAIFGGPFIRITELGEEDPEGISAAAFFGRISAIVMAIAKTSNSMALTGAKKAKYCDSGPESRKKNPPKGV